MRRLRPLPLIALLAALLLGVAGLGGLAPAGAAPQAAEPVAAEPVRGAVAMITGEGGNIGVLTGADGTLLVDAKFARLAEPIRGAIRQLGGDDPRLLLNTHFHADHTDGNAGFARTGALIVAHANVRRQLAAGSTIAAFEMTTPPAPPQALPRITFERSLTLHHDGQTIELEHLPAAHTDGDVIVHLREADVIHAGDAWFNGMYPFIDAAHGGSLSGAIAAADRLIALAGPGTRIIPGHGPLGDRAGLADYRAMLATARERLAALKARGLSAAEAVAEQPLADLEPRWGQGLFSGDRWIEVIWDAV